MIHSGETRGRPPSGKAKGNVLGWRPLTRADLASPRAPRVDAIQQIRARHHRVALLLARGWTTEAIAEATFTTSVSIRQLEKDPTVIELVAELQAAQESIDQPLIDERKHWLDVIGLRAAQHAADRLEDPEAVALMSNKDLLGFMSQALDRTGYGKTSELVVRDGDFATKLDLAIERSAKIIELRPPPTALVQPKGGGELVASSPPLTFRRA